MNVDLQQISPASARKSLFIHKAFKLFRNHKGLSWEPFIWTPLFRPVQSRFHRRFVVFTLPATLQPESRVQASSTYVVAPYGRMLCAMLASWHYPRANGQTLVTPPHGTEWLGLLWRRMACGCRVAMKRKKKRRGHK